MERAECSIDTASGVKVADVAWLSASFAKSCGNATPYEQAPEVCVEITSPSNSRAEMAEKMQLYFERGAREVWLCSEAGDVAFHTPAGEVAASSVAPDFPSTVG